MEQLRSVRNGKAARFAVAAQSFAGNKNLVCLRTVLCQERHPADRSQGPASPSQETLAEVEAGYDEAGKADKADKAGKWLPLQRVLWQAQGFRL